MSTKIVLQPVIPMLTVEQVDKYNFQKFAEFLLKHKNLFPALGGQFLVKELYQSLTSVYYVVSGEDRDFLNCVVFELGDYLVTSENGNRHFTKERAIRHGVVTMLPDEMFTPIEATILPDEKPFV